MGLIIFSLIVACLSYCISLRTDIDISINLPVVLNGSILLVYFIGLFGNLQVGLLFLLLIFFVILISSYRHSVFHNLKHHKYEVYVCVLFVVMSGLFSAILRNSVVWVNDDLNHWALVAKNMYYHNHFSVTGNTFIILPGYPELSAIPLYIAEKFNGGYSDGVLFATQSFWTCAQLFPIIINKKRNIIRSVSCFFTILLFPLFWGNQVSYINSLQVDILLGCVFGLCLFLTGSYSRNYRLFSLSICLAILSLIKETGIAMVIFVLIYYFVKWNKDSKKTLKEILLCGSFSILSKMSWNILLTVHNTTIWINTKRYSGIDSIYRFILGNERQIKYQTLKRAVDILFSLKNDRVGYVRSYVIWILFTMIIIYAINRSIDKTLALKKILLYFMGFILWWMGTMFVTLFKFSDEEMMVLSSYDRYLQPYILGCICFCAIVLFRTKSDKFITIVISCLVLMTGIHIYQNVRWDLNERPSRYSYWSKQYEKIQRYRKNIKNSSLDMDTDRIYVISQNNGPMSDDFYHAEYILSPIPTNTLCTYNQAGNVQLSYCMAISSAEDDKLTTVMTPNEFKNQLSEYSYIYIVNYDEAFYEAYKDMIEELSTDKEKFELSSDFYFSKIQ